MPDIDFSKMIRTEGLRGLNQLIADLNQVKSLEAPSHSILVSPDGTVDPALSVDNDGDIGIGTTTPGVPLHVVTDEASSPVWASADLLVVERDGGARVHIHSSTTSESGLWFTDTVRGRGQINYRHSDDEMRFATAAATRLTIESNGEIGVGTVNPGSLMEWNFATENLEFVDAGSAGATEQDWIEVQVGGVTGYIRVFAAT
jgi:hypothetical protein